MQCSKSQRTENVIFSRNLRFCLIYKIMVKKQRKYTHSHTHKIHTDSDPVLAFSRKLKSDPKNVAELEFGSVSISVNHRTRSGAYSKHQYPKHNILCIFFIQSGVRFDQVNSLKIS